MKVNFKGETIQHPDGRVELRPEAAQEISTSPLYNEDLAPVPIASGIGPLTTMPRFDQHAHCIPTYMLSSGLISAGMNGGRR